MGGGVVMCGNSKGRSNVGLPQVGNFLRLLVRLRCASEVSPVPGINRHTKAPGLLCRCSLENDTHIIFAPPSSILPCRRFHSDISVQVGIGQPKDQTFGVGGHRSRSRRELSRLLQYSIYR